MTGRGLRCTGTLTPFIPLSLRAIKGEGERKPEAHTCAVAQVCASGLVLGGRGRGWIPLSWQKQALRQGSSQRQTSDWVSGSAAAGRGTLAPFIPLSLRAFKGEGEEKTEAYTRAVAHAYTSSLVLGGGGWIPLSSQKQALRQGSSYRQTSDWVSDPAAAVRGTLTPFIPLSLRAIKGEGERKTEAYTCAVAQVYASSLILGGREESRSEAGMMVSLRVRGAE